MPTPPFGPVLESLLKGDLHGVRTRTDSGSVVHPQFFCCISGLPPVPKDPVAIMRPFFTTLCLGVAAIVDISRSYSPSFTILSYEIDWGDGNVDSGAWPPGGAITQTVPYAFPMVYTATLTVTDNQPVPGTASADVQFNVIDCMLPLPGMAEVVAGCGESGMWQSINGGISWNSIGLEDFIVNDAECADAFGHNFWVATSDGLYRGRPNEWRKIQMPMPGHSTQPIPHSIKLGANADELHVLSYYGDIYGIAGVEIYILHTVDGGDTWNYYKITDIDTSAVSRLTPGKLGISVIFGAKLYVATMVGTGDVYRTDDGIVWNVAWAPPAPYVHSFEVFGGYLYAGAGSGGKIYRSANGTAWAEVFDAPDDYVETVTALRVFGGYLYAGTFVSGVEGVMGRVFRTDNGTVWNHVYTFATDLISCFESFGSYLYAGMSFSGRIYRSTNGVDWSLAYASAEQDINVLKSFGGWLYAGTGPSGLVYRTNGISWWTVLDTAEGAVKSFGIIDSHLYAGARRVYNTSNGLQWHGVWGPSCPLADTSEIIAIIEFVDAPFVSENCYYDFGTVGNVWELDASSELTVFLSPEGPRYALASSADKRYIYVVYYNETPSAKVVRIAHDLSAAIELAEYTADWVGVVTDLNDAARLWIFGELDGSLYRSIDHGITLVDVGDAVFIGDTIRPLLPSSYNPNDVIVILNSSLEVYRTRDGGGVWTLAGSTVPFACHCGERDPYDPTNLLIGRLTSDPEHLQLSINGGYSWMERSAGITPNAPITVIMVIG